MSTLSACGQKRLSVACQGGNVARDHDMIGWGNMSGRISVEISREIPSRWIVLWYVITRFLFRIVEELLDIEDIRTKSASRDIMALLVDLHMRRSLQIFTIIAYLLRMVINLLSSIGVLGYGTIGEISNKYPTMITPAGEESQCLDVYPIFQDMRSVFGLSSFLFKHCIASTF